MPPQNFFPPLVLDRPRSVINHEGLYWPLRGHKLEAKLLLNGLNNDGGGFPATSLFGEQIIRRPLHL